MRTDAGSGAGSSQDVDLGDACPYGLVGKTVMVPGTWWRGGMSAADKAKIWECTVVSYKAEHQYNKGPNQAWFLQPVDRRRQQALSLLIL